MNKKKSLLSNKILSLVIFMAIILGTFIPANAAWIDAFQDGADRLAALQQNDGGWDWPLDDGDPNDASPINTIGPIAMGLAEAYEETLDPVHLTSLLRAGALLLTKTNNFSPSDGYLAAKLDSIFGGSVYVTHVMTNFYTPLANGTYNRNGAGTLYTTASYVQLIRDARAGQGIPNLAAWDIGMGLVGAASAGASTSEWIAGTKAEIDELDGNGDYDVIGLAGALYGLAFVGENFDPTAGEHATASNIADLFEILISYQLSTGGFTWNANFIIENANNETIQETAYALLALEEYNATLYVEEIVNAANYIRSVQLGTGGWEGYSGSGENNEITAEALWALSKDRTIPKVVLGANTQPANGTVLTTGIAEITVEFNQDVVNDGSLVAANNVINYLLVEDGANGYFETTSCAVPGGGLAAPDDVKIVVDSAAYDAGTKIATLSINGGLPLGAGNYRLFVCGTTSIENIGGIELNDGAADTTLTFSVVGPSASEASTITLPSTGFAPEVSTLPEQTTAYASSAMILHIPSIDVHSTILGIPMSDGSWDVTWLGNNVGWLEGSAYPTWDGNTVITGHVWNNTNTAGVFANLKDLSYGQTIKIQNGGQTYTYQVISNQLIAANQVDTVFEHEEYDTVSLLTCENFSEATGDYLNRRLVKAILVGVE